MSWKTILLGRKIFMYLPTTEESALVIKPFMTRGRSPAARSKIFLLGKFPAKTIIILDHQMTVVVYRDKSIRQTLITSDVGLGGALAWGKVRFNFVNNYRLLLSYTSDVARAKVQSTKV